VHAEIILEGDARQGYVLALDVHTLFGFDCLVQPLRVATTGHEAARELVDDDDLAVRVDDVLIVAVKQELCLERVVEEMGELNILRIVNATQEVSIHAMQHPFYLVDTALRRRYH